MSNPINPNDKILAASTEMKQFYHSLAVVHSNAVARVMKDGEDPDAAIAQAKKEVDRMRTTENVFVEDPADKCGLGYIWDATLGRCVPTA